MTLGRPSSGASVGFQVSTSRIDFVIQGHRLAFLFLSIPS